VLIASHSNEKVVWVFPANSGVSAASVMSCSWIGPVLGWEGLCGAASTSRYEQSLYEYRLAGK